MTQTGRARTALVCAVWSSLAWVLACSGKTEGEHVATVVRGSYGDPNPIVACGPPDDASADAADAARDGC